MTSAVPVIDLAAAGPLALASLLGQVRDATESTGVIQVVNHGMPLDLLAAPDLTLRVIAAGQSLAERVLGLYARAQGLPDGTFPVDPLPYLSLGGGEPRPEAAGACVLTVLAGAGHGADPGGGARLQVQRPDGSWLPVPAGPGGLLVLSGRTLSRWTNGRLRPARYRAQGGRRTAVFRYRALGPAAAPLAPFRRSAFGCPAPLAA